MNRAYTSASKVNDLRRPDWLTPMKVLVKKYNFVEFLLGCLSLKTKLTWCILYLNLEIYNLLKFYREVDDEDEGGGNDGEEFEDGELPPESDSDESEG